MRARWTQELARRIVRCQRCPRLARHCERVAREKKREFRQWEYWGRPVPSLGDPGARLLVIGLAPAAHGANRTGRMFTGDSSGRWLFRALHRAGFANENSWEHRDDGLRLTDCYITAVIHCAPPGNKPLPAEIDHCAGYLDEELARLRQVRLVIPLGQIAFSQYLRALERRDGCIPRPRPRFGHGAFCSLGPQAPSLLASYHPSRQNTNTGKLTEPMLDAIFTQARQLLGLTRSASGVTE